MLPSSWYKSKRGRSYFAVFQSNFQSSFWSWDIWKREKLTELKVEVVFCILVSEHLSTCLKVQWGSSWNLNWQNLKEMKGGAAVSFLSWYLKLWARGCNLLFFPVSNGYTSLMFETKPCYIYGDLFKWWTVLNFQVIFFKWSNLLIAMNIFFQVDDPLSFLLIAHFQESFNYANSAPFCSLSALCQRLSCYQPPN